MASMCLAKTRTVGDANGESVVDANVSSMYELVGNVWTGFAWSRQLILATGYRQIVFCACF
jgi:hypothetical protein